jgi:glycosyltransferase involved in cell wall biosynthesis
MKALVVFDGRFFNNSGVPSSHHLTYELFTKRYLSEFETVTVVGRLFNSEDKGAKSVIGNNSSFIGVPGYVGPLNFIKKLPSILKILWSIPVSDTAVFLRTPGTIPYIFSIILILKRKSFVVEVVADPYDQLSKGAVEHPIRLFFQHLYTSFLTWQCKKAIAAAYVTKFALQKRYPPSSEISTHYTSLNLGDEWFVDSPRIFKKKDSYSLLNIGMMTQLYKAQDIILKVLSILKDRGFPCTVKLIGDGEYRDFLQNMAKDLQVEDSVEFVGKISDRTAIVKALDEADLFILPSRQEGLPRVLIEAMSRALPCIATNVGGVNELLDEKFIINVDDAESLAQKIEFLLTTEEVWNEQSARNLACSSEYRGRLVQQRREAFYRAVKDRYHAE